MRALLQKTRDLHMEFGESDSRNLAKSLLSLHRKDTTFALRFATLQQANAIARELTQMGCTVNVDTKLISLEVTRPSAVATSDPA
jgi:hypothetical protein